MNRNGFGLFLCNKQQKYIDKNSGGGGKISRGDINMKNSKILIKFMLLFTTILMVLSYLFSVSSIYADGGNPTLNVSEYIKTARLGEEPSIPGTYNGEWSASIPMGKVMAGLEGTMEMAGRNGWYPHGKDGPSKIAYIEYTVTFPENVILNNDTITTDNTTSMFNKNGIKHTINGQSVTFKIPFNDVNWQGIYDAYNADGGATSTKTIDLKIPYSVTFNSEEDKNTWGKQKITAAGNFETHASRWLYASSKVVYNTDESTTSVAPEYAPKDSDTNPVQPTPTVTDLEADLLIGEDTGNHIITKLKTDKMDFVGALNVKTIKDQLTTIETQYQGASKDISLQDLKTIFTAELTLPQELAFPEQVVPTLAGANGKFDITSTTINGQTATVILTLKDSNNITTFKQLKAAVLAVDDQLKVTLSGVTFKDTATANTPYKVTGTITGNFSATATNTATNNSIPFNFTWNGKQSQAGASATDPNEIALSVQYVEPVKLSGDILVGKNTEHDAVYVASRNSKVAFTGMLDVTPVKQQLKQVMQTSGVTTDAASTFNISNYKSRFVATLTLPNELDFVNNPSVTLLKTNSKSKIIEDETSVQGKTITVTMTVDKNVTTLADLVDAVDGMDDTLEVVVDGVTFNHQSRPDTNYTVRGTMKGYLTAVVSKVAGNNDIPYYFAWEAEQSENGADFLTPNSKEITFSLKYTQPIEPSKPIVPSKPDEEPSKPVEPNQPSEEPNKPVEPNKPSDEPNKPVEPSQPSEEPSKPVKPETPTETTKVNQQSELPNTRVKSNEAVYLGAMILLLAGTLVMAPKRNMQ